MSARLELTGKTFGNCKFIQEAPRGINRNGTVFRNAVWLCLRCNTEFVTRVHSVIRGFTQSCGCLRRELDKTLRLIHGHSKRGQITHAYRSWSHMLTRCNNPRQEGYKKWGGRGITVCPEWYSFTKFLADMGPGKKGWSIERVNNDGNYEIFNCVWALPERQARNRRSNRLITINGKTECLQEVCERYGLHYGTIHSRLQRGWPVEKAIFKPLRLRPAAS